MSLPTYRSPSFPNQHLCTFFQHALLLMVDLLAASILKRRYCQRSGLELRPVSLDQGGLYFVSVQLRHSYLHKAANTAASFSFAVPALLL